MERPADSIASAERAVTAHKAIVRAKSDALQAKLRKEASSPKVIGGVLVGAIALGFLLIGGRSKQNVWW